MANDSANVELKHFNTLAEKFGIHFNDDLRNHVKDDKHFEDGAFIVGPYNPVLTTAQKNIYEGYLLANRNSTCILRLLQDGDAVIIAISPLWQGHSSSRRRSMAVQRIYQWQAAKRL